MDNVIRPNFRAQVIHIVHPDDEDWKPYCGAENPAYVADDGATKERDDLQWCPACLRAKERRR